MAFLRTTSHSERPTTFESRRLLMRPLTMSDYAEWAELRAMSRRHLQPWEPLWPTDDLSRTGFRRRLRHYQREAREDLGYAFAITLATTGRLIGGLSVSNLRRGVTQAATLGYWIGLPHLSNGFMTEAVKAALDHAFGSLLLHRVEAVTQPANEPSIRVLEHAGFEREGYARRYLKINGEWQDHILYACLAEDHAARKESGG